MARPRYSTGREEGKGYPPSGFGVGGWYPVPGKRGVGQAGDPLSFFGVREGVPPCRTEGQAPTPLRKTGRETMFSDGDSTRTVGHADAGKGGWYPVLAGTGG